MSERVGIHPSEKEQAIQDIKAVMKENKDLQMHERYQTILMILRGESYENIARVTDRNMSTLYNYSKAYRENRITDPFIKRTSITFFIVLVSQR